MSQAVQFGLLVVWEFREDSKESHVTNHGCFILNISPCRILLILGQIDGYGVERRLREEEGEDVQDDVVEPEPNEIKLALGIGVELQRDHVT